MDNVKPNPLLREFFKSDLEEPLSHFERAILIRDVQAVKHLTRTSFR